MRIAWIDDDTEIIEPVIGLLIKDGHHILRLRTVRDALDRVQELQMCDAILLDMILPPGECDDELGDYAGLALLEKLRKDHEVVAPVVILSVVDPKKIRAQFESLEVARYLRKPALRSEVKEAIDSVAGHKGDRAHGSSPAPELSQSAEAD
jgi:CheY-like chemotaxis protein